MLLIEIIRRSADYLAVRGIKQPRREAEEVIADVLGFKRLDLYLQFDRPLIESELSVLRVAIQRRSMYEPTAYIHGRVKFGGLSLQVTPDVLIPRPETEILVEKIALTLKKRELEDKILWDLCCGSGCIGLTLKNRFPQLCVTLSDVSEGALAVAAKNNLTGVELIQGDLFEPFENKKCDFLVCNPPYISESEFDSLELEVRNWEPKCALIAGKTGLEFYDRLSRELRDHLNPGGLAWLELGAGQGPSVQSLFEDEGWNCYYEPDWSGHDRFFFVW